MSKYLIYFLFFISCSLKAQNFGKSTVGTGYSIQFVATSYDGYVGLGTENSTGTLILFKSDSSMNITWVREINNSFSFYPAFIRIAGNSDIIFGFNNSSNGIMIRTDSNGSMLNQFLFDSVRVVDALVDSSWYYLLTSKTL